MQSIVPTSSTRNPNGHTRTEILAALQGLSGARRFSYRYELLDVAGELVDDLSNVLACSVEQNWLADIKRTASFRLRETGGIDYLSDRIKPYVRLHLPPYGDGDWVEWPQGVFLPSTPSRTVSEANVITRDIQAYDLLQVFADDLIADRYTVDAGTVYVDAVKEILDAATGVPSLISPTASTLPTDRDWEPGTSKLRIINDLLSAINYESLSISEEGVALVRPYVSPDRRAAEYVYDTSDAGLIIPQVDQELDLFNIPNSWVLVVSDPDRDPIVGTYVNSDPGSPTSTVRRGRTITDFRTEMEAADQDTLDAKAARLAFEASQVYEAIEFDTAAMPIHSGNDAYKLVYPPLSLNSLYVEHSWKLTLKAGVAMQHRARRVISLV